MIRVFFLHARMFLVKHEFTRFLLVGLTNTSLAYGVYLLLNLWLSYAVAYSIAYAVGFIASYFLNTKWVFQTEVSWKSFFTFPLVYVMQFLINLFCLRILVEQLLMSEVAAPLIVIVLSIPITFLLSRFFLRRQGVNINSAD